MDMLQTNPPSPSKGKHWPDAPAVRGKSYSVNDPIWPGMKLAVMTLETWTDFGTIHEQQRRKVEQQDKTLVALKTANDVLAKALADLRDKHENLKAAVKRQRKASVGFMS